MELWIRSQDKEKLLKVNDIVIEMNMIYGYFDKNTEYECLTTYKSKERALEILDELQDFISGREIMDRMNRLGGNMDNVFPTMTFIMPKE